MGRGGIEIAQQLRVRVGNAERAITNDLEDFRRLLTPPNYAQLALLMHTEPPTEQLVVCVPT
jgi:hypothetical protein